jgi:NADH dehydrogenase
MKHILVLGGTGFVGSHVCEKLGQAGYRVSVATRKARNASHIQHVPTLTVLELDIHNEAALTQVMQGVDAVVNLVAILHGSAAAFERVHVELPQKIGRACVKNGVRHLVHISALGVNVEHPETASSNYLRSKSRGEQVLQNITGQTQSETQLTVLRPSVIFGAKDQFLNVFAKLQRVFPVMPLACASAKFQPVWVEDVALAVVRCLQLSGPSIKALPVLEAVGPHVFTLKSLVQLAARYSGIGQGRGRPVIGLPRWMGKIQAVILGCLPGEPVMSVDNLDSMRIDNVSTGELPGLKALGIHAASLVAVAPSYLLHDPSDQGLLAIRRRSR